jgi:phage gpG-like protein
VIEVTATVTGAAEVQKRFADAPGAVRQAIRARVQKLGIELQRSVKEQYLDGPSPQRLRVRSGRLRRSINEATSENGDVIESTVGTPVVYGAVWERGFSGVQQVRAFTRTTKQAVQQVRAHSRRADMKARPFLQPALDAMRGRIAEQLADAVKGAV